MIYVSTRGSSAPLSSKKAIIKGIAEDHGLYVPSFFPSLGARPFPDIGEEGYPARAEKVLRAFLSDYTADELRTACKGAYGDAFDSASVAPVRLLNEGLTVIELWHGPTLAFKDMALQVMPRLLMTALQSEEERYELVVLVATSGDTGKAALEGFADRDGIRVFVFYPRDGVSEIQRLQMVTQRGKNVGVCGVMGTFDEAQTGVKEIFLDSGINGRLESFHVRLSSANSINWGRLAPQIVYYFTGYEEMIRAGNVARGQPINICVPTGNFGNILAAYYAVRCGLPVGRLICASNINNVLTCFIRTGKYDRRREVFRTESPSMDIVVSSNLERLLFELGGRNSKQVCGWMDQLATRGCYTIPRNALEELQSLFYGGFADHGQTSAAILEAFDRYGYLLDPHTAVGYSVLKTYRQETGDARAALLISTASPFKFSQAVLGALGKETADRNEFFLLEELSSLCGQPVPAKLAELQTLPEIHTETCRKEEMVSVLAQFLGVDERRG